ncbi:MAG: FHA domain-containing protein [Caldilineaceae bacterium]|nr:FHA domain-containing protein [Caldilineaceae bacterium]MCB9138527.1 FHA domain-containing protein [Caldilineaceae bacterium]
MTTDSITEQLPAKSKESAMLVLQRGAEAGRRWPLSRSNPLLIGRSEECTISLPDRQVSRVHARIAWNGDEYMLEDLDSKNGTHLNGQDIRQPSPLHDGDEIQIALRFKLAFVDTGATAPLSFETEKQGLRLDQETRQVWVNGVLIDPPLSLHQYRLLEALWNSGGGVVTREQIIDAVWPEADGEGVSEQAIDALVRRLRERIVETDEEFRYIVTVRGHGFRLENQ